jgi:hypothetical protein
MEPITLDTVTSTNVGQLTTVELIDILYDQTYRVQTKSMQHFFVNEPLLEPYDEHFLGTLRDCNPKMLALEAELTRRFQPLRCRLSKKEKARLTRNLKDLSFTALIQFTSGDAKSILGLGLGATAVVLYENSQAVLQLLLEGESRQAYEAVQAKWTARNKQRDAAAKSAAAGRREYDGPKLSYP